jgi:hypothetical protein
VRIEIKYPGVEGVVVRDFDTDLEDGNETRVCVAQVQTFAEQILYSSSNSTALALHSVYADCYLLQDYTKFAYSDAFMIRAYTIPKFYTLYIWNDDGDKTVLGSIDGAVSSEVNVNLLVFKQTQYPISLLTDDASISAYDNATIVIYYRNLKDDLSSIVIEIRNGTTVLYTHTETDSPESLTLYWDHAAMNLTGMILTLEITKYIDGEESGSITKIFYANGVSGNLNPWVAILLAAVLMFFGLTFVAVRYVFGYFGIIVDLAALAILSQAPATQFVLLMEVIAIIMMAFKILLMKEEFAKATVR